MRNIATFSPIGDISFLRILPRSVSINNPIVSSSRIMRTYGSQILHARILARGLLLLSVSLIDWRSVPSWVRGDLP